MANHIISPGTILQSTKETFPFCLSDYFSLKLQRIINVFK